MDSYANLKTEIAQWLNREGMTQLTDKVDTFLGMAQRRIFRDCDLRALEATATDTTDTLTLPSDYMRTRSLYLVNGTDVWALKAASPSMVAKFTSGAARIPVLYEVDGDSLRLAPSPDQAYTYYLKYYKSLPLLSDANTTNWFTANAPELVLFGALLEASVYLKDDTRTEMWRSRFEEVKASLQKSEDDSDKEGGSLQVTVIN